nr:hypothetical protein [Streptomyces sp. ODS05-4]
MATARCISSNAAMVRAWSAEAIGPAVITTTTTATRVTNAARGPRARRARSRATAPPRRTATMAETTTWGAPILLVPPPMSTR